MNIKETKLHPEIIKKHQQFIKDEIDNVEILKKEISNNSLKLKEDLLKLIKNCGENNSKYLDKYEKELLNDLETLNPNQKANSIKEIFEKAKKAEIVLNKKNLPIHIQGGNDNEIKNITSNISKIFQDNFKVEKISNIKNSTSKNQFQIKLNTEFSPLFSFFNIEPTDNFFKDFIKLQKCTKEEINFTENILKYIFDFYDKVILIFYSYIFISFFKRMEMVQLIKLNLNF